MENPADSFGLETLWRPYLDSTEEARAQMRLDQAWRALQWELPTLTDRIASGEVDAESAADVIYSATMRIMQNPEGLTSFNRAIDDASEGGEFGGTSSNDLYFTSAELRRLSPRTATSAFTIMARSKCFPWG